MPISTLLTSSLGIAKPIVQGGMMWVGYAEMAAAVSNAGGLGIIVSDTSENHSKCIQTGLTQPSPEDLRKEFASNCAIRLTSPRIRRCRQMTSKPFGVNITLLPAITPPDYVGYAKVIVEEGVSIVETAGNNPRLVIDVFKNAPYKIYILHKYRIFFNIPMPQILTEGVHQSVMRSPHRSLGSIFYL